MPNESTYKHTDEYHAALTLISKRPAPRKSKAEVDYTPTCDLNNTEAEATHSRSNGKFPDETTLEYHATRYENGMALKLPFKHIDKDHETILLDAIDPN